MAGRIGICLRGQKTNFCDVVLVSYLLFPTSCQNNLSLGFRVLTKRKNVASWLAASEFFFLIFLIFYLWCCAWLISVADWQWAPWARNLLQSGALEPRLLLLSLSNVGSHLLHQIPNKRILGSIVLPEVSMVSVIYLLDFYATNCILMLFGIQYGEWASEVSLKEAGWMCIRAVVDCRRRLWCKVQRSTDGVWSCKQYVCS